MSDLVNGAEVPWDFVLTQDPIRDPRPLPVRTAPTPSEPVVFDETTDLVAVAERMRQGVDEDLLAAACDGDADPSWRRRVTVAAAQLVGRRSR